MCGCPQDANYNALSFPNPHERLSWSLACAYRCRWHGIYTQYTFHPKPNGQKPNLILTALTLMALTLMTLTLISFWCVVLLILTGKTLLYHLERPFWWYSMSSPAH